MKTAIRRLISILCCAAFLMSFSACKDQGPAEKAGEQIDEAVEKTKEKMAETGEKVEEAVEAGGEKLEETGEKMQSQ